MNDRLLLEHEVRYMKLRSGTPIDSITKLYYPKVAIRVHEERGENYLIEPTGWRTRSCIWKYK